MAKTSDYNKRIAEHLREMRESRRIERKAIANDTGHDISWITKIESGDRIITVDILKAYGEALGYHAHTLLDLHDDEKILDILAIYNKLNKKEQKLDVSVLETIHNDRLENESEEERIAFEKANERARKKAEKAAIEEKKRNPYNVWKKRPSS